MASFEDGSRADHVRTLDEGKGCTVLDGQSRERSSTQHTHDGQVPSLSRTHGVRGVHEEDGICERLSSGLLEKESLRPTPSPTDSPTCSTRLCGFQSRRPEVLIMGRAERGSKGAGSMRRS